MAQAVKTVHRRFQKVTRQANMTIDSVAKLWKNRVT